MAQILIQQQEARRWKAIELKPQSSSTLFSKMKTEVFDGGVIRQAEE